MLKDKYYFIEGFYRNSGGPGNFIISAEIPAYD